MNKFLENAKLEFKKYVSNYDLNNSKINRKFGHSFRVMENAGKIAESTNLTKEQIEIAKLIGLLHDIGRFEQIRIYSMFEDYKSIDHGDLGVEILIQDNYIRKFIREEKYDNIILKAIKNHNKFEIEKGLTEEELLFAKIIRDADKWDIFYEGAEMFWTKQEEIEAREKSTITPEVLNEFYEHHLIDRKKMVTPLDGIVCFVGFAYDIYFKCTYMALQENCYVDKILDKFKIQDKNTASQIDKVRKEIKEYIRWKIVT